MLRIGLIGVALIIMMTCCASSSNTVVGNSRSDAAVENPGVHMGTADERGASLQWRMCTNGHVFFPLLKSTVVSNVASTDSKEIAGQSEQALQSTVGAWYAGLPVPAREIHVIGFKENSLIVKKADDPTESWYVPLRFVSTIVEEYKGTNESGLPEGRSVFKWPPDHFVLLAELIDISIDGECKLVTPNGERFTARPVLFTWCQDQANPKMMHLFFGHSNEDNWPRDQLDTARYQFWSEDRLTATMIP